MKLIKPPKLKKGDLVGLCSPSGTIAHKQEIFKKAQTNFERAMGLKTILAPHIFNKHYYSAGTPAERLADFHALLNNPDIKAIIVSAGGDTGIDLGEKIDYESIRKNPKIIAGISDATTILSAITARTQLITFLGLEFLDFAAHDMEYELHYLEKAWFEGTIGAVNGNPKWHDLNNTYTNYKTWQTIRSGSAEGRLIGGNSASFMQLLGTKYELLLPESILFLETYKLPKKQIHKTFMQLKLHGFFDKIQGLLLGYCLECDKPEIIGNEQSLSELVLEIVGQYSFPVMQVGEIGHCVENILQPFGAQARIDATNLQFEILENVTA